ncbi:MAG: ATP-binding cassette domain-containing protein [Methanomicrobiales archaeon]
MIRIENPSYRILSIDSLSLGSGVTLVIGPNGSGNTTLLKLCIGITVPESGSILIGGTGPLGMDIGRVNEFPDRNFIFGPVADEVASPLRFRHLPPSEITLRTSECLERFILSRLSNRAVGHLPYERKK